MAGTLSITRESARFAIELGGRANFATVVPLRDFVKQLDASVAELSLNLESCVSMDSTCMGVLSMLALAGLKNKIRMKIYRAGSNRQLLKGLGVEKLFVFEEEGFERFAEVIYPPEVKKAGAPDQLTTAETVLEAHETLIDADNSNEAKFGAVVGFAQKDVDRLKQH